MEKISVIIVSWNVADSLKRCLASLKATGYPNLEIIVIDNASTDDTLQKISKLEISLIRNSDNIGFPRAVNMGLQKATGEYLVLLNPDTVLPKDFFTKSLEFLKSHPDAGLMGPMYTDLDGTPQASVYHESSILRTNEKYLPPNTGVVDVVTFACVIFPRKTLDKIGFLTEEVFMYYEDFDYCRRIRAKGLKVYFNQGVKIVHEHGQSAKKTSTSHYRYLVETLIYPLRKIFNKPNLIPSSARYLNESAIWYNTWPKQALITLISWLRKKFRL